MFTEIGFKSLFYFKENRELMLEHNKCQSS